MPEVQKSDPGILVKFIRYNDLTSTAKSLLDKIEGDYANIYPTLLSSRDQIITFGLFALGVISQLLSPFAPVVLIGVVGLVYGASKEGDNFRRILSAQRIQLLVQRTQDPLLADLSYYGQNVVGRSLRQRHTKSLGRRTVSIIAYVGAEAALGLYGILRTVVLPRTFSQLIPMIQLPNFSWLDQISFWGAVVTVILTGISIVATLRVFRSSFIRILSSAGNSVRTATEDAVMLVEVQVGESLCIGAIIDQEFSVWLVNNGATMDIKDFFAYSGTIEQLSELQPKRVVELWEEKEKTK